MSTYKVLTVEKYQQAMAWLDQYDQAVTGADVLAAEGTRGEER